MVTYRETKQRFNPHTAKCKDCGSTKYYTSHGVYICSDCDSLIYDPNEKTHKKHRLNSQSKDGKMHNSVFEASVGDELYRMKEVGSILDYDTEYCVHVICYDRSGKKFFEFNHKIDFRIHCLDGSYQLIESKGLDSDDWLWRKRLFLAFWMPEHLDHEYIVRRQNYSKRER